MSWNNKVKLEAKNAAQRYQAALKRLGKNVRVSVSGTRILIGLTSYSAAQVNQMTAQLEARLQRDEELARSFG